LYRYDYWDNRLAEKKSRLNEREREWLTVDDNFENALGWDC
jgi:hypothetical protein